MEHRMNTSSKRIWKTSDKSEAPLKKKRHSMKTWGKKSRTCSCTWVPCVQETCTWWQYTYHYPCQDMQDIFPSSITCVFMKLFFWKNLFQKYIRVDKRECTTHTKIIYIYKVWSKESPETKQICIIFQTLISTLEWTGGFWNPGPGIRDPGSATRDPDAGI